MAKQFLQQCCCFELRKGCMILFTIFTIANIYVLISSSSKLGEYTNKSPDTDVDNNVDIVTIDTNTTTEIIFVEKEEEESSAGIGDYLQTEGSHKTHILASTINTMITTLGLYGVYKERPNFLLPWIILEAVGVAIYTLVVFIVICILSSLVPFGITLAYFVLLIIPLAIFSYMWCVVYSYYAVLQEENSRGLYDKQPYRR